MKSINHKESINISYRRARQCYSWLPHSLDSNFSDTSEMLLRNSVLFQYLSGDSMPSYIHPPWSLWVETLVGLDIKSLRPSKQNQNHQNEHTLAITAPPRLVLFRASTSLSAIPSQNHSRQPFEKILQSVSVPLILAPKPDISSLKEEQVIQVEIRDSNLQILFPISGSISYRLGHQSKLVREHRSEKGFRFKQNAPRDMTTSKERHEKSRFTDHSSFESFYCFFILTQLDETASSHNQLHHAQKNCVLVFAVLVFDETAHLFLENQKH